MPSAMAAMRACVSRSRSSITSEMVPFAACTSASFAARMTSVSRTMASAMRKMAAFFSSLPSQARAGAAAFAASSSSCVVMRLPSFL